MHFRIVLIIIVLLDFSSVNAQALEYEPITYNFRTEHGLPSLETYSVNQDSKGYLWICTDAGVCRFDGYEFKTFTTQDGLTDNVVFDTYEDYKGRIWFLTYNSKLCYYENEKIHKYKYNHKIAEFVHEDIPVKSIIVDSNNNVYFALKYLGLYKIDKKGAYKQLHYGIYSYLTKTIDGNMILSLKLNNLNEYKTVKGGFKNMRFNGKDPIGGNQLFQFSHQYCIPKAKYNLNNNYALIEHQIYDIARNKMIFEGESIIAFKIIDSIFWICTLKGLIKAELNNEGKLIKLEHYFKNKQFSNITKVDDCFFMTTIDDGVLVCQSFDLLRITSLNGLLEGAILSITKLKTDIIVSNSGIVQNLATNIKTDLGIPEKSSKKVIASGNKLVLFTSHLHIAKMKGQINPMRLPVFYVQFTSDFKLNNGSLFSVGWSVIKNDVLNDLRDEIYNPWEKGTKNQQRFLKAIAILPGERVFVGGKDGVFELIERKLVKVNLGNINIEVNSLDYNENWGLVIGSRNDGLYTLKKGVLTHYGSSVGLLSNKINTVKVVGDLLYIGTSNGLNVLQFKNGIIEKNCYSSNNYFENINVNVIFIDGDWVYLGTDTGILKLKKSKLLSINNRFKVKVKLKNILFDGKLRKDSKSISFPYSSNLLQINFSVFQFSNWTGKKFQYRLNKTGQWIDIESPSISMFRPSGSFDVQVRYFNADLSWSNPFTLCHVDVILPFWKRWYFWTLISIVIMLIAFLFYQRTQKRIHDKLVYDNQMLSLEQQMQNARMNPHFIFNVLNSIHSYVLSEEIEKADSYLMKFSKLMREILMSSKEGIITIKQECSILNKYLELEQLRHQNAFLYEIDIINIKKINCSIPSMMIQPFVENAVLYSQKTANEEGSKIKIEFVLQTAEFLHVKITNSGAPSEENLEKMNLTNTKNAIGITRSRLDNYNKLLNTDVFGIDVQIINKTLTSIYLIIPIMHKSELNESSN